MEIEMGRNRDREMAQRDGQRETDRHMERVERDRHKDKEIQRDRYRET